MDARELDSTVFFPAPKTLSVINPQAERGGLVNTLTVLPEENHILYTNGVFFMIRDESNVYRQIDRETMDRFIYMNYTKKLKAHDREEVMKAIMPRVLCAVEVNVTLTHMMFLSLNGIIQC